MSVEIQIPDALINALQSAKNICVLTGAGISAESGIPTFRDALTGLWAKFDPQELATPEAFAANPKLVWDWYTWRRDLLADKLPNPGHRALVHMASHVNTLQLVTQNVDGLHQMAGSADVIELHGNISRIRCSACSRVAERWTDNEDAPPACSACGSFLRPDVVWFGEGLSRSNLNRAVEAAQACDIIFSIGTAAMVYPAAALPELALDHGALFVEINPNETPLTRFTDVSFQAPSGELLPQLIEKVWGQP